MGDVGSLAPSPQAGKRASALYLHIPFCSSKCLYCDFASWTTRSDDPLVAAYTMSVVEQVKAVSAAGLLEGCETAYVGGGTPSLLGDRLVTVVEAVVGEAHPLELTCEANPDSLDDELLDRLSSSGATRLSVGVQSTNDAELRLLGRRHSAAEALSRLRAAVASGLAVSCDLMCATPGQSAKSWHRSLSDVVSSGVGHVSVYPLAIEEGTALARIYEGDSCAFNDEDVEAERMEQAEEFLLRNG
ncbi:MAG: radical SAM protein, partial [Olsenella sp.]|nr:radical SAM protein [Olsenella sp.]